MALNPRIKELDLGVEELTTYKIFPLSMADEFKISDIIAKAMAEIANVEGGGDVVLINKVLAVIKDNLGTIIEMVTKKDNRPKMDDMDNVQFSELAELIFDVNFAGAIKNFRSLVDKVKSLFQSTGQSQPSSETPVIE